MKPVLALCAFALLPLIDFFAQPAAATDGPCARACIRPCSAINTPADELGPAWYRDGIVFVAEPAPGDPPAAFADLFFASVDRHGELHQRGIASFPLNSRLHEGPAVFSADFQEVYFGRTNKRRARNGRFGWSLFTAGANYRGWHTPHAMPFNSDEFSCIHPALSRDGRRLYFSSDRPGGLGGFDLWYVERRDTGWTEPANLGPAVNTARNEVAPFAAADGRLYFATDGRGGLGDLDIFFVENAGDPRSAPVNLGAPLNSPADDLGLILSIDGKSGFFASKRAGGAGGFDLYHAEWPEQK